MSRSSSSGRRKLTERNRAWLHFETLEDRCVPTTITNAISGYVYYDANNDGVNVCELLRWNQFPLADVTLWIVHAHRSSMTTVSK